MSNYSLKKKVLNKPMILLSMKDYLKENNDCFQKNSTPWRSKAFSPEVLSFVHETENITRQNEKIPFSSK